MKNKSIGSLLILAILAPSCGSGGGGGSGSKYSITPPRWSSQYRIPTSSDLRAVRFGNALQGIAAGKYGTFVRTDDGGNTWQQLEHTPASLTGDILAMQSASTTIQAVGTTPTGGNIAWQSLDATTFTQADSVASVFPEPWVDLSLVVPASSSKAADTYRLRPSGKVDVFEGTLVITTDSTVNLPVVPAYPAFTWQAAKGIAFLGVSGYGAVCGRDGGGNGAIRLTSNISSGWQPTRMPASLPTLNRVWMVDPITGFACGDTGAVVMITPDPAGAAGLPLGQYWDDVPNKPAITANLNGIMFLNATTGWVVGAGGKIYRLRYISSAWTWDTQTSNTTEDLYDVWFVDANNGFAVGNNGVVVKTTNGGTTWTVKSGPATNPTAQFNAVDFTPNAVLGLAGGQGGTIVRTLDGGATWTPFNSGVASANITAVRIPRSGSGTVAFAGTDTGALFVNTDLQGTGTWQAPSSGSFPAAVKALLFPKDDSAGIVAGPAGNYARLAYATVGGLTVTTQALSPAPSGDLFAAAADPSGNTLYLGGDGGYLVNSVDAGLTWAAVSPAPPNVSIRSLQAPSGGAYTIFAAATDGNVWRLSAGGTPAWSSTTPPSGTPVSLAFADDATGWVVTQGATGGIFYTTTSGTVWTRSILHVQIDATAAHSLNAIWMSGSTGTAVGGNGVILRTTTGGQ